MKRIILCAALLLLGACVAAASAEETGYHSDFSAGTDGWYPRSLGGATLAATDDGALAIAGRSDNWHSPGRDFGLRAGETYALRVEVMQDEVDEARFMISVAHSTGGVESYENLAFGTAKRGEWTALEGTWTAGAFDRYVLYVETAGAPTLSFMMRDFTLEGRQTSFGGAAIPALKDLYADLFDFGAAVTGSEALNARRMAFYASQFSIMTPGNELKPDFVLDVAKSRVMAKEDDTLAAVRFDAVKPLLDFARDNGVKIHGHVLVWHSQTPEAFFHVGYDPSAPLVSREVMLARLAHYVEDIMTWLDANYPGVVVSWDVVNEAVDDGTGRLRESRWTQVVGEDFVLRAFEIARRYAPAGTLLYYNDYNTALEPKQTGIMTLLNDLMTEGHIDGYGFQMHHDVSFPSLGQIEACVARVAATGLRLRVSELDVTVKSATDEAFERQAAYYAGVMRLLLPYAEQLEAVQVWGVTDDLSWRASQYPLLFDAAAQPKPAFWAVARAREEEERVVIPEITVKEFDLPENEALAFARGLGLGWNLGNTMDAADDRFRGDDLDLEGYWCGVKTTKAMFEALREKGFSTVRIPVSWHNHVSGADCRINEAWMNRVQQLVDWALESGLNVILNTHHDNVKGFCYPDEAHLEASTRYLTAIWTQVAERFRDYDDRLIFESMNEPRLAGTDHEWWFDAGDAGCLAAAECINRLNQAFVDTVRAAGGANADRYLMVPGYDAAPANADPAVFRLPEDSAPNRLIVSAHAYLPYSFALDTKGTASFDLKDLNQTGEIGTALNRLYEWYVSQGIPVVMGEFGALNKDNLQDRVDLTAFYVAGASARGIPCLWWDNNAFSGSGENFGLLNRSTLEWPFPEIVEAAMRYALR